MEENVAELRKMLAGVAVENQSSPPILGGLEIFSFPQATQIVDFFCTTYA